MAVDPGLKDTYVARINDVIQQRKDRLQLLREHEQVATFEQQAEASLSPADLAAVQASGLVGKYDLAQLQAEELQLQQQINALQAFRQSVKAL